MLYYNNTMKNTYQQTLDFLFTQLPMFQRQGTVAMKKNLDNILALCKALGNPQNKFKSIHIAGTNGKGSVCAFQAQQPLTPVLQNRVRRLIPPYRHQR